MKKTRMPQRLLSLVLVLMMLISVLPVSAMAAELTPSDPETGLTATDVTNELTDSDRLAIFEENMDSGKVSRSEIPADDEMVKVIVQLDADSLLDVRNRTNANMSMLDFQQTDAAKAQLKDIANLQLSVMNTMESKGIPSSFTFSYTSVVSGFAAEVPYGKIHDIKNISGVEDVVLCQTYYTDSMGSATLGQALTAAEVAAYSNNTQYQGEGMLIGILDTGLDVNHEAFANAPAVQKLQKSSLSKLLYQISQGEDGKTNVTAYSYAALWYAQKHSSSSLVLLTEDDLYKSGKVPFAFDYADADADVIPSADAVEKYGNDHGTHVAGITAGKTVDADGSVAFAGQSPEAQLAIFKVFSDSTNGASTDTILAALNDALLLDVDVINMSLGSNGGFGREAEGDLTTKYYDLVKSAGILLNCSAGNSYSSSQGGAKGDFTSVSDPDTGIISSSSSYDAALSVASVNANETAAFVTAQGRVPYQDVSGHDFTALLLGNDSSKTYEYVMVPNTGDTADYQGLDVTGKIAVVMRGGLSFEQKQLNAASAGAAGCIIYNNRDGYLLNMAVDNYKIPTVCISLANGQMMEAAQEKTLTVSKTEKGSVAMSDFSSWGPLPSLSLKPEITAPGGSIYSSLPFAQYGYMSGTSMASPYLAGVSAAALEYVNTLMPSASDTDKQLLVNRLLMSTADILYDENGVAYSPRKQGSGMVNLAEAVTTPAYLYVRGQDKTKIELGDDADQLGVYKLSFVVKNLTGSALSYDVNTTVQTESTTSDGLYIAQKGYVLSADTSTIVVNNAAGTINMSTDGYTGTAPYVSLLMSDGQIIKANAEKKEANGVTYYVGKLTVGAKPGVNVQTADYYTMSDFSSWGVPGSLELKPEITAPGGNIYSLQNGGGYQNMSGTSMASPQVAGMAAVVAQYIRANKLTEKTGLTARALAQSLLMSTAVPMYQDYGEGKYGYYSVMQQGAGLANVGAAVSAGTYIMMDKNANAGAADGKVKVELGDDPARTGEYNFGFTIYNLKDAATSFNLSADFFTQNVLTNQFEDGSEVNFEHTYTALLSSNVTWTVDGQVVEMTAPAGLANCDFNGDGKVTKADGQALLDFVTGVLDSISNKDNADFDNDGNIDTYDAYLFFQQLNKSTVEIPANGSIHVEVNAKVLGLDKYDEASDNTGTYVEGYVYADEVASAEGVKGDSHSIPVLGYYGSWTDPSMFDIGSYLEYHEAKTESRVPYMYAYNKNATKYQALAVQYAGDSGMYYFGGNPYMDETYDPNRAAINPDTTVFARATFSLIRNAADARVTITGENGNVYYDKASGSPTAGAYYYSNGGSWRNAQGYIGINNAPTKAAEGEKITVKVTEAPEYYVTYDAEGNATTNWDALGDGASRTYTAYVDRTEPVLSNVYFKEDVETGTRSLVLTAQDNRYVAAAFLIDYDKMSILDGTAGSPEGAAEGAATDVSLDLSKAEGVDHLYIQVCDYANNAATYKINLNKEELSGPVSVTLDKQSIKMYKGGTAALNAEVSPFGVKPDGVTWKSSDETVATVNERGIITGVNKGTATITAASIKDPTATASCVVTVQTVDTTLVGALMDTNGDAQFYTWDMEHDTTWKKLVAFESLKTVSATTFDYRNGVVYVEDGENFDLHKLDLDTGKTLATYPGFEGEIPMWDMEYSLVYSTEAKPMLASVYATYFMSPKPVDNLDLSAFDLGLYLWLFADASYFTAVTSLGANKIDTDKDGVKDTDTELFLALDDAGNIWTMNVYPTVDEKTGKDTWGASFGILESNLANVGYAANPTDDGDLYDSLYATVEGQELVLYLANFTGDASHVYRILLNEDTGKWEAADIGNFGDGVWPATLVGTMYHANEDAAKAVNAAMSKTTVHTAQAVEMTPAQIQRYNGAETQAAKGSLNTAAPVAAVVNLPMGDAAENATASNVTVSADEKTVTVNVLAKDAATNGLFTVDYDAANLTLTNVAFNTQYSSYKDASGKVTLGYVDLNGVAAGSTVATLTFTVNDPTALDKINVTVTETERNDQTVNNAETLTADLHTETETVNAKAATCTEDGYTGDVVCKACGKVITKGEVIPALGHKIELVGAKAATCTEDGYTGDEVCTVCGEIVKKGEVIPALGHKIKLVGAKEPTCTEDGYTGDEVCTICGEIVKKGEVIKATGHQYKDGKCTVCGAADPNYKPAVKTGDESNTALWVLVMASAALLAAAVVVLPRKKHSR